MNNMKNTITDEKLHVYNTTAVQGKEKEAIFTENSYNSEYSKWDKEELRKSSFDRTYLWKIQDRDAKNLKFKEDIQNRLNNLTIQAKKSEMEYLCRVVGLPTIGNKTELYNNLVDYRKNVGIKPWIDNNSPTTAQVEYVAETKSHIVLARWAVRRLSSVYSDGRVFSCYNSCQSIRNSGYRQHIFEDICQELFIDLQFAIWQEDVRIFNGWFATCPDRVDELSDKYPYILAMRSVQDHLYRNKVRIDNKVATTSEILMNSIEDLNNSIDSSIEWMELYGEIRTFAQFVQTKAPKTGATIRQYLERRVIGYTNADIAKELSIKETTLHSIIRQMRKYYSEYLTLVNAGVPKSELIKGISKEFRFLQEQRKNYENITIRVGEFGTIFRIPENNLKMVTPKLNIQTRKIVRKVLTKHSEWKLKTFREHVEGCENLLSMTGIERHTYENWWKCLPKSRYAAKGFDVKATYDKMFSIMYENINTCVTLYQAIDEEYDKYVSRMSVFRKQSEMSVDEEYISKYSEKKASGKLNYEIDVENGKVVVKDGENIVVTYNIYKK